MATTTWEQRAGMTSPTDTDNLESFVDQDAATTTWAQRAGMLTPTEADNLESFVDQAEESKDAAASSAAAAAASATNAATSETSAATSETAAASSATASATSASASAGSATASASSASSAAASEAAAATSEGNAATSATNAATSATDAATSATNASTSAIAAASSEANAAGSAASAASTYDDFDDRYLGAKASEPTLDNDGDPLITGALYFNTTDGIMKVFDGSLWVAAYASLSDAMLGTNNLSDVASVPDSRANLGLGTAATTAATDYATAAQGALADSAVQPNDSPSFGSVTVSGTVDGRDVAADGSKLDGIEAGADVTDTANVTAAGALMDSEVTNLAQVKAFNSSDYATAAQGSLADSAVQPNDSPSFVTVNATTLDLGDWTVTEVSGVLYFATGGVDKMKLDASGNLTVVGNVTAYGTV